MTTSFDIIVCGGGLGGLACAIGLVKRGHRVTVLEATRELSEVGAGIQVPPNSVRILKEYGIYDKFAGVVTKPANIAVRRYANGELLNNTPLDPDMTEKYGNPPAWRSRSTAAWSKSTSKPELSLEDGETYTADLIIGADGIKSSVRDTAVVTEETVLPLPSSYCAYRVTIPGDVMAADPVVSHLMTDINSNCWVGYRRHIMAYPSETARCTTWSWSTLARLPLVCGTNRGLGRDAQPLQGLGPRGAPVVVARR
ncbi:3-hydroxybenzoate 6-hydroxylase 1 [Candida viswanathii]|uniref:3-hydroxybenzoate 6-hydroxylase 1 n=1 Tax=Candida viswanathii TaxID=5486 RepID=A0A367XQX1_9ASCO|nr:3-hydroxybenzoate 6-hydroxylase 1 [Candida viswanathii]